MSKVEGLFRKHTERRLIKSSTFDFGPSDLRPFNAGFTMVELLVVLAIIAVITTISIPTIDAMTSPKHTLRKEGRKIMQLMTEARMTSMSRKMQVDLRIDSETREIHMVEAAAYRAIPSDEFASSFSDSNTNRYERTIVFDEGYELEAFTADQIITDDEDDSPFSEQEESMVESSDEMTGMPAVSFLHFGGSSGGGISLIKEGIRIDIAADVLTGRPRVVRRMSESQRSNVQ